MIEIWTEDSTTGYKFLKSINKVIYNNQIKIVPHYGISEIEPTSSLKYGGILYHLRNYTDNNLVLLCIDKAIDEQGTAEHYSNVVKEVEKHNNIYIINMVCFELGLLSYTNLFRLTGNKDANLYAIIQEFIGFSTDLKKFRPLNFSTELRKYIDTRCGRSKQYEHVSKNLLSDATNVNTIYNKESHYLSLISGGTIGSCWVKDCCTIPYEYRGRRMCTIPEVCFRDKIVDLVTNSSIKGMLQQIDYFICQYIDKTYKKGVSDDMYREKYFNKFGKDYLLNHIGKLMETRDYWNYERLYRSF